MSEYYCTNDSLQGVTACNCQAGNGAVQGAVGSQATDCVCRDSFVQALQMLLRGGFGSYLDFTAFAFVTDSVLIGTNLAQPDTTADTYDNLGDTLEGTFSGFTPGACNFVDVAGTAYTTATAPTVAGCFNAILSALAENTSTTGGADITSFVAALNDLLDQTTAGSATENPTLITALNTALACGTNTGLQVSRLSLCSLRAIAFEPAGDVKATVDSNYTAARQLMANIIQPPCQTACPPYPDPCTCPEFFDAGRTLSVSAGPLDVSGAVVLGRIGQVLVLANDVDERFYFICTENADIIR